MSSNYPPGAANDPRAPWNEVPEPETEVTVRVVMVKETVVAAATHRCTEWEIEPDGSRVCIQYDEADDVLEAYRDQEYTPQEIMTRCMAVCRQLKADGQRRYAGVNIERLADACDGWEEEELEADEKVKKKGKV